ncbi:MAG: hypothetical protein ACTSRW_15100 [Candidatus Helarchaeota archaeon]
MNPTHSNYDPVERDKLAKGINRRLEKSIHEIEKNKPEETPLDVAKFRKKEDGSTETYEEIKN